MLSLPVSRDVCWYMGTPVIVSGFHPNRESLGPIRSERFVFNYQIHLRYKNT